MLYILAENKIAESALKAVREKYPAVGYTSVSSHVKTQVQFWSDGEAEALYLNLLYEKGARVETSLTPRLTPR